MARHRLKLNADGSILAPSVVNSIRQAFIGEIVGRAASGSPTEDQNLGTGSYPWADVYAREIYLNLSLLDEEQLFSPDNAVLSGTTRTLSTGPDFLLPVSGAASGKVVAFPTPLVVKIDGVRVTVSSDLTIENLTLAPSANNTCLVNDVTLAAQELSRVHGSEDRYLGGAAANLVLIPSFAVDTMGSSISALVGKWAAFKLTHAGVSEYLLAYVESTTRLSHCFRGHYFDSTGAPIKRVVVSDNDTFVLMKAAWIFLSADGSTLAATYNAPTWSQATPSSPSTGDYWYDLSAKTWKKYNGTTFVAASAILIGTVICDSTGAVAARGAHFFRFDNPGQNARIERSSSTIYRTSNMLPFTSVRGTTLKPNFTKQSFDTSSNFAAAADTNNTSVSGSHQYFLYQSDDGNRYISDVIPFYRFDYPGFYHPYQYWRCLGQVQANSGSLTTAFGSFINRREMNAKHTLSGHIADPAGAITITGGTDTSNLTVTVDDSDDPLIFISGTTWRFLRPGYFKIKLQTSVEITPLAGAANNVFFSIRLFATSNHGVQQSNLAVLRREQTPVAAHYTSITLNLNATIRRPDVDWTLQGVVTGTDSVLTMHEAHVITSFLGSLNR